jgi:LemA protein
MPLSSSKRSLPLFIGIGLLLVAVVYTAVIYNRLVKQEEAVKLNWSELQNVYKRRLDMVPTLVTIVQGAASFEKELLQEVMQARSKAGSLQAGAVTFDAYQQQEAAQAELAGGMNRLIAVVEAYPDLKAAKSFVYLQAQLEGTERRIKFARKDFNAAVNTYNTTVRQLPSSLVAAVCGFRIREGFKADTGTDSAPEVKF